MIKICYSRSLIRQSSLIWCCCSWWIELEWQLTFVTETFELYVGYYQFYH